MKTNKTQKPRPVRELSWGILAGCVGASLRFAEYEIYSRTSDVLAPFDLTPRSFTVLVLIDANHQATQGDIGSMMLIKKSNFAGLIAHLEARGLISRAACIDDARRQRLRLSAAGHALLARASVRHDAFNRRLVARVGSAAHARLVGLLDKLRSVESE